MSNYIPHSFIFRPWFIFLCGLMEYFVISFVGEISGVFLLMVMTFFVWYPYLDKRDRTVKNVFWIFVALLLVQVITEQYHGLNTQTEKIKGIAVTITGMTSFFFYYTIYSKNADLVKWLLLGQIFSQFLFPSEIQRGIEDNYTEEQAVYLKFVLAPAMINGLAFLSLHLHKKIEQKSFAYAAIIMGAMFIPFGARSFGMIVLLAGLMFIYTNKNNIPPRTIWKYLVGVLVLSYGLYAIVYVPRVLSGEISSGNSEQILRSENPYNPIEILKMGRADAVVPLMAFLDKPLEGWGYKAEDPDHKYATILFYMGGSEERYYDNLIDRYAKIPGHSVFFYYCCCYGIGAFVLLFFLYGKVAKRTILSIQYPDKQKLYRLICFMMISWHFFFSPMPHFKSLPGFFAFLLVSCMNVKNTNIKLNQ